jgi:membrane fusion protein (multidrug efflux system)
MEYFNKNRRNMNKSMLFLGLIGLIICGGCNDKNRQNNINPQGEKLKVEIYEVHAQDVPLNLSYLGSFKPFKEATLGTTIPGKIEKIYAQEGEAVKEGQLVVKMSSELLLQSEIEYKTLEKDFQRVKNLVEKQSISQQDFDHVKAQYEAAEAKYNLLKANTEIRAPFDGVVARHLAHEGENYFFSASLDLGSPLSTGILQLVKYNPIYFEFEVGEKDLSYIHKNMGIKAVANTYSHDTIVGMVEFISPTLNSTRVTATIRIRMNNPNLKYRPGMTGKTFINVINHQVMMIPLKAMMKELEHDAYFVYLVNNEGKITKKPIKVMQYAGENVVVEGLSEGDQVVISSKKNLAEGTEVEILPISNN